MDTDATQGMLFATLGASIVDDSIARSEIRLCALNVNSPSETRAQRILDWLLASECNVLVLTELPPREGGQFLRTGLDAEGFRVTCTPGWSESRFLTVVATKGFDVAPVQPAPFDPRVVAVDLASSGGTVRVVGIYGPTNGMTVESSLRRGTFQRQFLSYLNGIHQPRLCLAGDLNVVEPDHTPPLAAFEEHDYAFYRDLLALGLRDAYRACQPDGTDHSWFSPRFGSQRLDHVLVSDAAGTLKECAYDHSARNPDLSDHAALRAVLQLNTR